MSGKKIPLHHIGKVFERLILKRLQHGVDRTGGLGNVLFSFQKGKSTVDGIVKRIAAAGEHLNLRS